MAPTTDPRELTAVVKASDIYRGDIVIPSAYDVVDFRIPRPGDTYLPMTGPADTCTSTTWTSPRYILRRKPRRRIIFEEVGERVPKKGDWWYSTNPHYFGQTSYDWLPAEGIRHIFTCREETF